MNIHHYRNLHLETFPATNRQVSHELNRLGAEGLLDPLAGTGSATETSKKKSRPPGNTLKPWFLLGYVYIYLEYIVYILGHNLGVVVWIGEWDFAL